MNPIVRVNIDAAAGGTIMSKTPKDALELFKNMENTQSLWANERVIPRKGGKIKIEGLIMVNAKLDALTKRMDKMGLNAISSSTCELFYRGASYYCMSAFA